MDQASAGSLTLRGEGSADWVFHDSAATQQGDQKLGAGGGYRVDKHLPEISALIDPQQFDLITEDDSQLVVVRGVAGSGKTTVALHRLAYLDYKSRSRYRADRMMVVVWGDALRRFISKVLQLSESRAPGPYLRILGRKDPPAALPSPGAVRGHPGGGHRLKLHPVMLAILEDYVAGYNAPPTLRQAVE